MKLWPGERGHSASKLVAVTLTQINGLSQGLHPSQVAGALLNDCSRNCEFAVTGCPVTLWFEPEFGILAQLKVGFFLTKHTLVLHFTCITLRFQTAPLLLHLFPLSPVSPSCFFFLSFPWPLGP